MLLHLQRTLSTTARLRSPAIKFRYGANRNVKTGAAVGHGGASTGQASAASSQAIYDFELPARYHRKPIDQKEMDCINYGGAV